MKQKVNVDLMPIMVENGRYATVKGLDGLYSYDFVQMSIIYDNETE